MKRNIFAAATLSLATLSGQAADIVDTAVAAADVAADNGVIHAIDTVLIPK